MKPINKVLSLLIIMIIVLSSVSFAMPAVNFDISSDSAVLIDATTGQVFYNKNPDKVCYPAGLTKIMASLIILDEGNLEDVITMTQGAIDSVYGTNTFGLVAGEVITIKEALYGMLLQSSNDFAVAAALGVCASTEDFVKKMNEKAVKLGLKNTHFTNVTGLYNKDNYTTASDMAIIVSHAMKNPEYIKIAGAKTYSLSATNKVEKPRTLTSKCALLGTGKNAYPQATTAIAGYTDEGKYTLASSATNGDINLIAVTMNCSDDAKRYSDAIGLFNFAFNGFHNITINNKIIKAPSAKLVGALGKIGDISFSLDKDVTICAPVDAKPENLKFEYKTNKKYKKSDELTGVVSVVHNNEKLIDLNLTGKVTKRVTFFSILKIVLIILLILFLLAVAIFMYFIFDAEKKKKKRRQEKLKRTFRIKQDI